VSDGIATVKNSSDAQRAEIIRKFKAAKPAAKERQEGYDLMAAESRSEGTRAYGSTDGCLCSEPAAIQPCRRICLFADITVESEGE